MSAVLILVLVAAAAFGLGVLRGIDREQRAERDRATLAAAARVAARRRA